MTQIKQKISFLKTINFVERLKHMTTTIFERKQVLQSLHREPILSDNNLDIIKRCIEEQDKTDSFVLDKCMDNADLKTALEYMICRKR